MVTEQLKKMESDEGKNPISLIHEYCQSRQAIPSFKIIHEEGEAHAKMFTVSCTVFDTVTTGIGRSLKQARSNCAQSMLEKLKNDGLLNADCLEGKDNKTNSFSKLSDNLLQAKIQGNPVGCLQEYCMSTKIPLPDYTDVMTDNGFKTICKVNDITCEGSGRQKKLAKAESARKMCEVLFKQLNNESETNVNGTDENKKAEETTKQGDEESENHSVEGKSELNNNSGEVNGMN